MTAITATLNSGGTNKRVVMPAGTFTGFSGILNATPAVGGIYGGFAVYEASALHTTIIDCANSKFQLKAGTNKVAFFGLKTIGLMELLGTDIYCIYGDHSHPLASWNSAIQTAPDVHHSVGATRIKHFGCDFHDSGADMHKISKSKSMFLQGVHGYNLGSDSGHPWHSDHFDITSAAAHGWQAKDSYFENHRAECDTRGSTATGAPPGSIDLSYDNCWVSTSPGVGWDLINDPTLGTTLTLTRNKVISWGHNGGDHSGTSGVNGVTITDTNVTFLAPGDTSLAASPAGAWRTANPYSSMYAFLGWPAPGTGGGTPGVVNFRAAVFDTANGTSLALTDAALDDTDILIAWYAASNEVTITPTESGWTAIDNIASTGNLKAYAFWRPVVTPGATWTFTVPSGNISGMIVAVSGADTTTPIEAHATNQSATNQTAQVAPSVTTVTNGDWIGAFFAADNVASGTNWTAPALTTTEVYDPPPAGQSRCTVGLFDLSGAPVGATGTFTATATVSDQYVSWTVAVKPAPVVVVGSNPKRKASIGPSWGTILVGHGGPWTAPQVAQDAARMLTYGQVSRQAVQMSVWQSGGAAAYDPDFATAVSGGASVFIVCLTDFGSYGNTSPGHYPLHNGTNETAYAADLTNIVNRYKAGGAGGVPAGALVLWELQNEPNVQLSNAAGDGDVAEYAYWYNIMRNAIKAVNAAFITGPGGPSPDATNRHTGETSSSVFTSGTIDNTKRRSYSPLDWLWNLVMNTGNCLGSDTLKINGRFEHVFWHAYEQGRSGGPFNILPGGARPASWPNVVTSFPASYNYGQLRTMKEAFLLLTAPSLGNNDPKNCFISATEIGADTFPLWNSTTTYTSGQKVFANVGTSTPTLRKWNRAQEYQATALAGNLNKPPASNPTFWTAISVTSNWEEDELGYYTNEILNVWYGRDGNNLEALDIDGVDISGFTGYYCHYNTRDTPSTDQASKGIVDPNNRVKGTTNTLNAALVAQAGLDDLRVSSIVTQPPPGTTVARKRFNNKQGSLDSVLTTAATSLVSSKLSSFPLIVSPDYAVIVLDPDGLAGDPEIAYITDHPAGLSTATLSRAQENTIARQHGPSIRWEHVATAADFEGQLADGVTIQSINGQLTIPAGGIDTLQLADTSVNSSKFESDLLRIFTNTDAAKAFYAPLAKEGDRFVGTDSHKDYRWNSVTVAWEQTYPVPLSSLIQTQVLVSTTTPTVSLPTAGASISTGTVTLPTGWNSMLCIFLGHVQPQFLESDNATSAFVRGHIQLETPTATPLGQVYTFTMEDPGAGSIQRLDPVTINGQTTMSASTTWSLTGATDIGDTNAIKVINRELTVVKYRLT